MQTYIGTKVIRAKPMSREAYNALRGWQLPDDEDGTDPGFLVEYVDGGKANHPEFSGYISWSPLDVFNRAYKPAVGMDFSQALLALKSGSMVAREGWNGKGMFLIHVAQWDAPTIPSVSGHSVQLNTLPFIAMRVVTGELVPWLASQTDLLSNDWTIL